MVFIKIYIFFIIICSMLILYSGLKNKVIITLFCIFSNVIFSSFFAIPAVFQNNHFQFVISLPPVFNEVPLVIDALSGWFVMIINIVIFAGSIYAVHYLKNTTFNQHQIAIHSLAFIALHLSLLSVFVIQHFLLFIIVFELTALSAFVLLTFEYTKRDTIKAGINYFIQSHISIVMLTLGVIIFSIKSGSFKFSDLTVFSQNEHLITSTIVFIIFFIGFAIKAGFIPFHTWLPYAHPAAPAHISGIMSGIIIKIGIYGILRMILCFKIDYYFIGIIILIISIISGIYGVMLAIIQHNLKRLLAYHSIENIGIIGMGIGLGCIGLGKNIPLLIVLGFAGSLLHTLNHALFKSLLFFSAGNVYKLTKTMHIENLGGLFKKMPATAILFLLASVAICGLPPLNGFVSEFLLYAGFYNGLINSSSTIVFISIVSIVGLVIIGGLAVLCFTKAFSIIFLGNQKKNTEIDNEKLNFFSISPLVFLGLIMLSIGIFPQIILHIVRNVVVLFLNNDFNNFIFPISLSNVMQKISIMSVAFISIAIFVFVLKRYISKNNISYFQKTWGCGYAGNANKCQYSANSYVKTYKQLSKPLLEISEQKTNIAGIYPSATNYHSSVYDKMEKWLIDKPLKQIFTFLHAFILINNGKLQRYILFGVVFIASIIFIPALWEKIKIFICYLNQF